MYHVLLHNKPFYCYVEPDIGMINEISPHRFSNHYLATSTIRDNDVILHYSENSVLLKISGNGLELPRKNDIPEIPATTGITFLFSLDTDHCFLLKGTLKTDTPHLVYRKINFFRTAKRKETAWISMVGYHLMNWYSRNKFCGKCGARTRHKPDERALCCPECRTTIYPEIAPAIITAVTSHDKILLVRSSHFPGSWYSLIAGYVDIGESVEEAVKREVKEEVGLNVKNVRYYKSQPWPVSGSMMLGFVAEADERQPVVPDGNEITDAAWFTRGNLPACSPSLSIAGEMIESFEHGKLV